MSDIFEAMASGSDDGDPFDTTEPTEFVPDEGHKKWVSDYVGFDVLQSTGKVLASLMTAQKMTIAGYSAMTIEAKRQAVFEQLLAKLQQKGEVGQTATTPATVETKVETKVETEVEAGNGQVAVAEAAQPELVVAPTAKKKTVIKAKESATASDVILVIAHKVENLDEASALALVKTLAESRAVNEFELGGVLATILVHEWFTPHASFKDWCNAVSPIGYRKARYLISIYSNLLDSGVKWSDVESLGWTKLRILAKYLTTENVTAVVEWATNCSVVQIEEQAEAKWGTQTSTSEVPESKAITSKTFKFHDDQLEVVEAGLSKAMQEKNTQYPAVAMEHICLSYLGEPTGAKLPVSDATPADDATTMKALMTKFGAEGTLNVFSEVFPEVELEATM